jgi:hypothetical protein
VTTVPLLRAAKLSKKPAAVVVPFTMFEIVPLPEALIGIIWKSYDVEFERPVTETLVEAVGEPKLVHEPGPV